ncbi:MAG: hypothetical protein HY841_09795 [Bacteroidetes bacterium]|nr:hypothetical protein [Bacteroidota bacterium]
MKKIFFLLIVLSTFKISFSQDEKTQYIRKGLFRAQGTISPGILLKENASTISLHGGLEYYVADNVSLRGDSYYFLQAKDGNDFAPFEFNHSIFSGASYHFKTKNHFDPYIAIEPGIAISKRKSYSGVIECFTTPCPGEIEINGRATANPLFSSAIGFNFFFQKWFHLFGEVRYVTGKNIADDSAFPIALPPAPLSLNELKFSFGLGFNLNLIKKKE